MAITIDRGSSSVQQRRFKGKLKAKMSDVENQEDEVNSLLEQSGSNGSPKNKDQRQCSANTTTLILLIAAWYASSVLCTNTSKSLGLQWEILTFFQMLISSVCAICGIVVFQLDGHGNLKLYPTEAAAALTILLSVCFCAGFVTLNASLGVLHVSSVMTMRAAEPVATYLLGLLLVPNEKTSFQALICLVPIVLGAGLSAVAKTPETDEISVSGLMLVLVCNICFALRTIITKILKTRHSDMDNYNLFLQLCLLGCLWQGVFVLLSGLEGFQSIANIPMLLLNGLTFYLYLQLSWVVMGMVDSVTHSVCNSLRRPVICAAGWIAFGGITVQGVAGVLTATAGTLLYARAKQRSALRLQQ